MTEDIEIVLLRVEAVRLSELAADFQQLVASPDHLDEAVARLTPNPYPGDPDAAAQFAQATSTDLLDRRTTDAATLRGSLAPLVSGSEDMSETEAFAEHRLRLASTEVDAWLRAINALRLVLASRLGIADDDTHDPDDPRYGVYDWLGYRLELLIEAANESHG